MLQIDFSINEDTVTLTEGDDLELCVVLKNFDLMDFSSAIFLERSVSVAINVTTASTAIGISQLSILCVCVCVYVHSKPSYCVYLLL